jgi:acetyl esterase/lipase
MFTSMPSTESAELPGLGTDLRILKRRELVSSLPGGAFCLFDQPYTQGAGADQTLDLFVPPGTGAFPLIVWIHGGGWNGCNKDTDDAGLFLRSGFALASLDYRLIGNGAPFPAQIEDCFSALVWLRENGAKYRVDSERIGLVGHSAGAHLAGLIATTGGTDQFCKTASTSTRVQAAVLWSGPLDLGREGANWPSDTFVWNPEDPFCTAFFPGGAYDEEFARWASPASYLRAGVAPMLIVHGGEDLLVPAGQALAFAEALRKLGGNVSCRIEPECGHDTISPTTYDEALRFFRDVLDESLSKTDQR